MAIKKCKECGGDVSTKANACPKCGAKAPKGTSLFTWVVLVFIIFIVYAVNNTSSPGANYDSSTSEPSKSTNSQTSQVSQKVTPPKPKWNTFNSRDEMTGEFSAYAHSPQVSSTKAMSFPYNDVRSWMGVGCNGKSEWVYFGFSTAPNLDKDETQSGYNLIKTRLRWDENVEDVALTQDWGSKFVHFKDDILAISRIKASNSALLELQWHGQQSVYYKFSLNGSSDALTEIRTECSQNK